MIEILPFPTTRKGRKAAWRFGKIVCFPEVPGMTVLTPGPRTTCLPAQNAVMQAGRRDDAGPTTSQRSVAATKDPAAKSQTSNLKSQKNLKSQISKRGATARYLWEALSGPSPLNPGPATAILSRLKPPHENNKSTRRVPNPNEISNPNPFDRLRGSLCKLSQAIFIFLVCLAFAFNCDALIAQQIELKRDFDTLINYSIDLPFPDSYLSVHGKSGFDRFRTIKAIGDLPVLHSRKTLAELIRQLNSNNTPDVMCQIVKSIGKVGHFEPKSSLSALEVIINGVNHETKLAAIRAIGSMGKQGREGIPLLIGLIRTEEGDFQWEAIYSLVKIAGKGDVDSKVIPLLIKLYQTTKKKDLNAVFDVIKKCTLNPEDQIVRLCNHEEPSIRNSAYRHLAYTPEAPGAEGFLDVIIQAFKGNDDTIKAFAMEAVDPDKLNFSNLERFVLEILENDHPSNLVESALICLAKTRNPKYLPITRKYLKSKNNRIKHAAIYSLSFYGKNANSDLPNLLATLQRRNSIDNLYSAFSLLRITRNPAYIDTISEYLTSSDDSLVSLSCAFLSKIGKDAKKSLPRLVELSLKTESLKIDKFWSILAMDAIRNINQDYVEAVPMLNIILNGKNIEKKLRAAGVLSMVDKSNQTIEILIRLLSQSKPLLTELERLRYNFDWALVNAMGNIGVTSDKVINLLKYLSMVGDARKKADKLLTLLQSKRLGRPLNSSLLKGDEKDKIIEKHEGRFQALADKAIEVLKGTRKIELSLLEKHGYEFKRARGNEQKNLKYLRWYQKIKKAKSKTEIGETLLVCAREVHDEDDSIEFIKMATSNNDESLLPDIGILELLRNMHYQGKAITDLSEMLITNLNGISDLSPYIPLYDGACVGYYLSRFVYDKLGFRIRSWTRGDKWKIIKYIKGPWPKIIVEVVR